MDQLQYQKKIIREEYGDLKKPAEEATNKKDSLPRPKGIVINFYPGKEEGSNGESTHLR